MRNLQKTTKTQVFGLQKGVPGGFWGNGYHPQIREGHKKNRYRIEYLLETQIGAPPTNTAADILPGV